ncbi:DUF4136 domain-containing protein [Pseudonocardia sp. TMWB2A]|uniref:DUF4136 domain-containing protein n=1 Tax=Pseudonocardia sp. TMWB2A TaxID=687430 RepID=UPI00307DDB70
MPIKSLTRRVAMITAPLALLTLGACATPFQANVQRFQQMPPAQGQSFTVTAANPDMARSLEFQHYAGLVSQKMGALGYRPATSGNAELVVHLDYGVDKGRERIVSDPTYNDPFWGPWGGYRGYYGRPFYGRYGRFHRPYMWGFNDPFLYGPGWNSGVRSYTVYVSHLGMTIERGGNKERLFEGSAEALSRDNDLTYLVPNLIDAMFTGFPGNGGEKVKISLPPKKN